MNLPVIFYHLCKIFHIVNVTAHERHRLTDGLFPGIVQLIFVLFQQNRIKDSGHCRLYDQQRHREIDHHPLLHRHPVQHLFHRTDKLSLYSDGVIFVFFLKILAK